MSERKEIKTAIIAAIGENGELGAENQLLWRLPKDTAFFTDKIKLLPTIMGRKTAESPDMEHSDYRNIIVSRQQGFQLRDFEIAKNLNQAWTLVAAENREVMVCGGAQIYNLTIQDVDRLYITHVHASFSQADAFFPPIDPAIWKKVSEEYHPKDHEHTHDMTFCIYEKI